MSTPVCVCVCPVSWSEEERREARTTRREQEQQQQQQILRESKRFRKESIQIIPDFCKLETDHKEFQNNKIETQKEGKIPSSQEEQAETFNYLGIQ